MTEKTDQELIEESKNGNAVAMEFLFLKYKKMINTIARQYFLIGAEQEDLVQEGMLGFYKACKTYSVNMNTTFKSFAYLCIKRQIQSAVKKANTKKNYALSTALYFDSKNGVMFVNGDSVEGDGKIVYLPFSDNSPEKEAINKENYDETLNKIKNSLSDFEYKILELYLDGFKCGQIASLTNNTYKAIDNALYRIKSKLQFLNNNEE